MAMTQGDFWKLVAESQLLTPQRCQHLSNQFAKLPGRPEDNAQPLAAWLVRQHILSKYQATILLAGRTGPFVFGDYRIQDRLEGGSRLSGMFRAVHTGTNHPVLLKFLTTPVNGIADSYLRFAYQPGMNGPFDAVSIAAWYHLFDADLGSAEYGDEIDVSISARVERITLMLKYAAYQAESLFTDTDKLWFSMEYAF